MQRLLGLPAWSVPIHPAGDRVPAPVLAPRYEPADLPHLPAALGDPAAIDLVLRLSGPELCLLAVVDPDARRLVYAFSPDGFARLWNGDHPLPPTLEPCTTLWLENSPAARRRHLPDGSIAAVRQKRGVLRVRHEPPTP